MPEGTPNADPTNAGTQPTGTPPAGDTPPPPTGEQPPPATGDEPLGEPGKRALEAERRARQDEERRRKLLEAELEQLRQQQMTEQERALAQARKEAAEQARTEERSKTNRRLFAAEVRAAAAGKLADPDLLADPDVAIKLLGFDDIPVNADGEIDSEAISQHLADMLNRRPYLGSATRPAGSADQGPRGTPPAPDPAQLTNPDDVLEWAKSNRSRRF